VLTSWRFIRSKLQDGKIHAKIFVVHPTESGDETYMAGELIMPATDWSQFIGLIRNSATANLEVSVEVIAGPPLDSPPPLPQPQPQPHVAIVEAVKVAAVAVPMVPPKPASKFTPVTELGTGEGDQANANPIRSDKEGTN